MAWNSVNSKDIQGYNEKSAQVPIGAPISVNPSFIGRAYKDGWDIQRAYREGMQKVTWVYRCVDAIAGNQARLPVFLRDDNSPEGKIISNNSASEVLNLLNSKANIGENSFVFRYRLSSQLLMSTRGVFIEKIRGRGGDIVGVHLLPPEYTAPIPDPKTFVAGFEVLMPDGSKKILRPDDVVWIRRPHPLDPYRSLTPMEAAGVAIEIENLAKLYNRNFLLNDGRPGGILNVRGEIDDDDKEELKHRFRGNINRSGAVTVLSSDDGVDFIDTGSNPRDAAYTEMRNITKEEILSAFGVPETAIGNAAGRTFSNAAEELRVFWMETMLPHLHTLARGLDELDDKYYIDFNTDEVPILVLYKQERERYLMNEFRTGLISGNEYRSGTGRKKIKSELMDAMLANPNLTPIGNTEKKMETGGEGAAAPGMPVDMAGAAGAPTPAPPPGQAAQQAAQQEAEAPPAETPAGEPTPAQQAGLSTGGMSFKGFEVQSKVPDEWDVKAEESVERWTEILDRNLERLFERQERVILEKAGGAKARKALQSGTLSVDNIFDSAVWDKQMEDDIRPVLTAILKEAAENTANQNGTNPQVYDEEIKAYVDDQVARIQQSNETTKEEISAAIITALAMRGEDDDGHALLKAALIAIFLYLLTRRKRKIAEHEAQTAYNAGVWHTANLIGGKSKKTWVTRKDGRVRNEHRFLEGKSVDIDEGFTVGGSLLRFPGDPLAPPSLTIGCRCRLKFGN
jgi:hypothetical protein